MKTSFRFLACVCVSSVLGACGATVGDLGDAAEPAADHVVMATVDTVVVDAGMPIDATPVDTGSAPAPDVTIHPPVDTDAMSAFDATQPRPDVLPPPLDSGPRFPVAPDGAVIYPADAGYTPGTVSCGTETCSASTQDCCINTMTRMAMCVAHGACMAPTLVCDGPEDCPSNQTCCLSSISRDAHVACLPEAMCGRLPIINTTLTACHSSLDCSGATVCCNVGGQTIFGFMVPSGIPAVCLGTGLCPAGGRM